MTPLPRHARFAGVLLWSTVVWVALWSDFSVANVLGGLVLGVLAILVVPLGRPRGPRAVRPLAALRLLGHFLWALVRASAVVAWEIVTPPLRINQGVIAVPLRTASPALVTLIANMVSLTPGTLTLEVGGDPPTLHVHVLHLRTIEEARADVRRLEDLTLRAFPIADRVEPTGAAERAEPGAPPDRSEEPS